MIARFQSQVWRAVLGLLGIGLACVRAGALGVTLGWDPSPDPDPRGYVVYSGTKPGVYNSRTFVGPVTNVTLRGFAAGKTYYIAASTIDGAGYESHVGTEITVTLPTLPGIGTQPQALQVLQGSPASFNVVATGSPPFGYQWQFNGAPIAGATTDTLTLPAAGIDQGGLYSVVVTNVAGSITSSTARLTVTPPNTPPTLTSVADVALVQGDTPPIVSFTIADAETPVGQLVVTASSSDEVLLPSSLFALSSNGAQWSLQVVPGSGQVGSAYVTVSVSDGARTSSIQFQVTVAPAPPTVTLQPADQSVLAGATVQFSVAATGTSPFTYQWRFNNGNLPGATNATLVLPAVTPGQAGTYSAVVQNVAGQAVSRSALLQVTLPNTAPSIDPVPDLTVNQGTALPPVTVTVRDSQTPGQSLTLTASSSNDTLLPSNLIQVTGSGGVRSVQLIAADGRLGTASVTLTVSDGELTASTTFTVTVVPVAPTLTLQPADQSVLAGATVQFSVAATGTSPFTYQWRFNNGDVPGATNATLVLPAVTPGQAGTYSAVVQNVAGQAVSRSALLQVTLPNTAPSIDPVPDLTVNQGVVIPPVIVTLRDTQTPGQALTLTASSSDDTLLPSPLIQITGSGGVRTVQLVPADGRLGTASVTLTVSDGELTTSATFGVSIVPAPPSIVLEPADQTVFWGTPASFQVAATGTPPFRYQWQYGNTDIPGATNATLLLSAVTPSREGLYTARVQNDAGVAVTHGATLQVLATNWPPTFDSTPNVAVYIGAPSPTIVRLAVRDFETPVDQLQLTASSSDESLLPSAAIGIMGTGNFRELKLAGAWRTAGSSVITLNLSDGALVTTQSFLFSVVQSNAPPTVDAGKSGFVATGANYLLRGRVTDDGWPADPGRVTVEWRTVSGPADAVFGNPESVVTSVSFNAPGIYRLRLTASDGEKSAAAEITLDASGAPDTVPPVISGFQIVSVRDDSITLSWTTDSLADEAVEYAAGTDPAASQSSGNDVQLTHTMTVTNLAAATTYTLRAHSRDLAGNDTFSEPLKVSTLRPSPVYVTLHPEDAVLTPPMILDSSADGLSFLLTQNYLSGGSTFTFHLPVDGEFRVWMRVLAVDNNTDSFFVHMDDGAEDVYDAVHNQWAPSWQWDLLNGRAGSYPLTENPRTFTLSAGPHTLYLRGRETNCALSRIVITNDRDYVPTPDAVTQSSDTTTLRIPVRTGWSMVGNPLATASTRLSDLLPALAPGTTFYKYQVESGKLIANFFDGTRWSAPDMLLMPGEGGLLNNRSPAFSWLLQGAIPAASTPPSLHAGPNFLVLQPPLAGLLPGLLGTVQFQAGDSIQQVDFHSGVTRTCTYNGERWDILPVINLGEPFFLNLSPR